MFLRRRLLLGILLAQILYTIYIRIVSVKSKFSWESPDFTLSDLISLSNTSNIPNILHQSYKSRNLPTRFKEWSKTWHDTNPQLRQILWTDQDNDLFIKIFYPYFYPFYKSFPRAIHQIDSVRYLYLHKFGGIYADLDTIALKNIDPLLDSKVMLASIANDSTWNHDVPNAWMASVPGHDAWLYVWSMILYKAESSIYATGPELVTGPIMLFEIIPMMKEMFKNDIKVLPAGNIYGEDWRKPVAVCLKALKDPESLKKCIEHHKKLYVLTLWSHSWE